MRNYIVGPSSTGKTRELLDAAKRSGATVVCKNPEAMLVKANNYGMFGLRFCSYGDIGSLNPGANIVIDDLDEFIAFRFNKSLCGFSVTED